MSDHPAAEAEGGEVTIAHPFAQGNTPVSVFGRVAQDTALPKIALYYRLEMPQKQCDVQYPRPAPLPVAAIWRRAGPVAEKAASA